MTADPATARDEARERKIVQIAIAPSTEHHDASLYALADDGSLWASYANDALCERLWWCVTPLPPREVPNA